MIPMEIHGMVRACRPITPYVGICRQSRDPERTRMYYREARKERDTVCFASMLREATRRCMGYRAIRRLWIQTLNQLLHIQCYKFYLIKRIIEYIPMESPERIPPFYSRHSWKLDYTGLSVPLRMEQFAGKLHSLGYSKMVLVVPDYELEGYLVLSNDFYVRHCTDLIPRLYHELARKKIVNKWPILTSHIRYRNLSLTMNHEEWLRCCRENKLTLCLNACLRVNTLTPIEIELLEYWIRVMKYPNR